MPWWGFYLFSLLLFSPVILPPMLPPLSPFYDAVADFAHLRCLRQVFFAIIVPCRH